MGQLHTRNCTIFFVDVEDGQFRANALALTCESDLQRLASLFRISFDVDGLNRGGVRVYIISPPGGGLASNPGYGGYGSPSDMDINGDYAPAKPDLQTPIVRGELVRMLFAAELSEIMMDITPGGWNRGSSEGEALSVVLATELRPMGYYSTAIGAPRVNAWLQSSRPDWISRTELTDQNQLSYGCGILFINYLRHQLKFDLARIMATRPPFDLALGGRTLAGRYAELTGNPAAQAYPEFMAFLERHLPQASAPVEWVGRDDIFPLQAPQDRKVYMSASTQQINYHRDDSIAHVALRPGFLCGEREYQYWRVDEVSQITASASSNGFASANFEWSINGTELQATGSFTRTVEIQTDVSVPQPNRTVVDQPATTLQVDYRIQSSWNASTLFIRSDGNDGIEHLKLHADATEKFFKDASVGVNGDADLPTLHYEYARNFYDDQQLCNGDLVQMSSDLAKLSNEMRLFLVTPDPQPDLRLAAVLAAARVVNARIDAAAHHMGATGQVYRQELIRGSRIAEEAAAARNRAFQAQPPALENTRQQT
jgi:hypothetical protein